MAIPPGKVNCRKERNLESSQVTNFLIVFRFFLIQRNKDCGQEVVEWRRRYLSKYNLPAFKTHYVESYTYKNAVAPIKAYPLTAIMSTFPITILRHNALHDLVHTRPHVSWFSWLFSPMLLNHSSLKVSAFSYPKVLRDNCELVQGR